MTNHNRPEPRADTEAAVKEAPEGLRPTGREEGDNQAARSLSREEKNLILRERAKRIAQRPETEEGEAETIELIEFTLAHEHYAVEVGYVREVYPLRDMIPVPCTPSFIMGIINVRGQVVSVTDIRGFFDLPRKETGDGFRVLIM
ncbi:MAG: chemotaxis protein CheW, partial [Pseudomonadota bacterium]